LQTERSVYFYKKNFQMRKPSLVTRSNILNIALRLFLKKGYKDVSYKDLMKETGLSKGAIYHHFASKDELLASVFEFLLESTTKPSAIEPENEVKDLKSFRKLFIDSKIQQFNSFKEFLGTKSIKFNKLLFFLEAINENEKLKKIILELLKQETLFLEKCFISLKKHNKLPKGKDPVLMAQSLFWMLQGSEMLMFFVQMGDQVEDFIKMYNKTLDNFFKII
jgi:AcrR family transcriptional regulator